MFDIRNVATAGFDRAIVAMRRGRGGREVSDSYWQPVEGEEDCCFFVIGEKDAGECRRLVLAGDSSFLKFAVVWAHITAPAKWWSVYGGYFIARSEVDRRGDTQKYSVMATYAQLRNMIEAVEETADNWKMQSELREALAELPESWMILPKAEREG